MPKQHHIDTAIQDKSNPDPGMQEAVAPERKKL